MSKRRKVTLANITCGKIMLDICDGTFFDFYVEDNNGCKLGDIEISCYNLEHERLAPYERFVNSVFADMRDKNCISEDVYESAIIIIEFVKSNFVISNIRKTLMNMSQSSSDDWTRYFIVPKSLTIPSEPDETQMSLDYLLFGGESA